MIPKIFSNAFIGLPQTGMTARSEKEGRGGFQAILEKQMEAGQPLEGLLLTFLADFIDRFLNTAENDLPPWPSRWAGREVEAPARPLRREDPMASGPRWKGERPDEGGGQDIDRWIDQAAAKFDVEPALIRAVIQVESHYDPRAVSPAGARGLMQLMPGTASDLGVQNPFDPQQNIEGGTRYLKQLLERYGGNRRLALAAYNWGMGNLERRPEVLPQETRRYIVKVEKAYEGYAGKG